MSIKGGGGDLSPPKNSFMGATRSPMDPRPKIMYVGETKEKFTLQIRLRVGSLN